MNDLQEIAAILDRYKARQIEVLTNEDNAKENRYAECYAGLKAGKWPTDREMAAHFGYEAGGKAFLRFKNEVKKRLLNALLFIDTASPELADYGATHVWLLQQWTLAQTLMQKGALQWGMEMARQILAVAEKFEHFNLAFEIIKAIQANIYAVSWRPEELARLKARYFEIKDIFLAEVAAREAYESLVFPLVQKKGFKRNYAGQARALGAELSGLAHTQSVYFQNHYRLINLYADVLEHNWSAALEQARAARDFFQKKTFQPVYYIIGFAHHETGCLIMLNRFQEARAVAATMLELVENGSFNWFKMHELDTVACFYAAHYLEAWDICRMVLKHPRFKEISAADQESWRLFQGYLYLLAKAGVLRLPPNEKAEVEKFRLSSWLNDLPLLSQDKRGANIPILLVQAFFLLLEDRTDDFDNRMEALRKYRQRNLDAADEHFRTDCFIRLLELAPKNSYRPAAIKAEAPKWLEKMGSVSADILDRSYELEVVPYERMWQWLLNILEKKPMETGA